MEIHVPSFSRRRLLRLLGQGALLASVPGSLWADESETVTISVLHTTDLHGHILPTVDYSGRPDLGGLARCASQIRQWQRANSNHVLVDIGDVYQGTEVSLRSRGAVMTRCLNALAYDAWVIGNHEFDWGFDAFAESLQLSAMPVLCGNALIEGCAPGVSQKAGDLGSKVSPYLVREVAGFKLIFIGLTTPALTTWLPPEDLRGFEALDPVESLGSILREVESLRPDAILLAGHMGLTRRDDYANQVGALTRQFPQLTVYLGGHTHQNHAGEVVNNILYTQADHYGIYAGKVDLTFDRRTRRLLARHAVTVQMDGGVPFDPLVLSLAKSDLADADQVLAQPIGELTEPFASEPALGRPSEVERLIGSAMRASLLKRGVAIDAVVHGLFDDRRTLAPGVKTVGDIWNILPYENEIVTIDLSRGDLLALAQDFGTGRDFRNIMGLRAVLGTGAAGTGVIDLRLSDGSPLPEKPAYRVALNSYDSQSGGERFLTAARLVAQPSNRRVFYPIETRDAVIDFFLTRQKVGKASLLV